MNEIFITRMRLRICLSDRGSFNNGRSRKYKASMVSLHMYRSEWVGKPWELRRHWTKIRECYRLCGGPYQRSLSVPLFSLSFSLALSLPFSTPPISTQLYPRFAAQRCYRLTSSSYWFYLAYPPSRAVNRAQGRCMKTQRLRLRQLHLDFCFVAVSYSQTCLTAYTNFAVSRYLVLRRWV